MLLRFICSAYLCLVLVLTPLLPSNAHAASVTPLPAVTPLARQFGIVDAHEAPDMAERAGAGWQRALFFWEKIQPEGPEDWVPNPMVSRAALSAAKARGMDIVGVIGNPPEWATRNGSVPKNLDLPLDAPENYWARFVERLARENAGLIDEWIIWNEPDFDPGMPSSTWAGSEEEYYRLLKTASLAIKRANPRARIVFAGTTYWVDVLKGRKIFLERILERGALDPTARQHGFYFDVVNIHLYSSADQLIHVVNAYRDVLNRYGLKKPIWIAETNVVPHDDPVANVPRGGFRASLQEQASFIVQVLALARVADVERIAVYKLVDGEVEGGEPYGLVRNDGTVRPAFVAFQVGARYLAMPGKVTHTVQNNVEKVVIDGKDRRVTVLWNKGPTTLTAKVAPIGATAKLVTKDGIERVLEFPTDPEEPNHTFTLAPATANTADNQPSRYIIGGDPLVLVEEGFGLGVSVSPDRLYFPLTGFGVEGAFRSYFERRGGLRTFGYPISRPFRLQGKTVQLFQRQMMELRPDGTVGTANLLDPEFLPYTQINGAVFPSFDPTLTDQAPAPGEEDYAARILNYVADNAPDQWQGLPVRFGHLFNSTVTMEIGYPDGDGDPSLLPGLNLELWGIPTSKPMFDPTNHNFVYLRFQRGIMHHDRTTGETQGLLLAEYFKSIITGVGIPPDLASQVQTSRFLRQYDPNSPGWIARPSELPDSDLTRAFEREAPRG